MSEKSKNEEKNVIKGVIGEDITKQMQDSFIDYAMSVITHRALPDVRDGLKPVHRRLLYAMDKIDATFSSKTRKSSRISGEVIGKYHPHGDVAVYEAMVGLAQNFTTRYPLVIGQGNFGSVDGDPPGAQRYTEAKMSKISSELIKDIDKDTVSWRSNYDNTLQEPIVFPGGVPNLLLNGSFGIAVAMATTIPPHNLNEVCDAILHLIKNKEASVADLMKFIKGPDFPLGAKVYGESELETAYNTGRGGITVRGEAEIEPTKGGEHDIIISSIPFRVNKSEMLSKIDLLVRDKKIEGIKALTDESAKDIRIVIKVKSSANPNNILNKLYKHTRLEERFNYNMIALVKGIPELLNLKDIIQNYIDHRREVVVKRTEFDLDKAEKREHILLGIVTALDNIDAVIKLIRGSKDTATARSGLMKKFKLSEIQANAILEMRLQRLVGLERDKVLKELKDVKALIKELKTLLGSSKKIDEVIETEVGNLKKSYGDDRRTQIIKASAKSFSEEDLVPEEESVLVLTNNGYVKRTKPTEYKKQKRGGVGVKDLETKEEDFIRLLNYGTTHDNILYFSNKGKVYKTKMYEIPEGKKATKGKALVNFLSLQDGEKITSVLNIAKDADLKDINLFLTTKKGLVKNISAGHFKDVRRSGFIAINLDKSDELVSALLVDKDSDGLMVTSDGQSIRFPLSSIRVMGRTAKGVKGINLKSGDSVIDIIKIPHKDITSKILTISEKGLGKATKTSEYKIQKRGGGGVKTMKVTDKTGKVVAAHSINEEENPEVVIMSKKGLVIRMTSKDLPVSGRQTQGVKVMNIKGGDSVATTICI